MILTFGLGRTRKKKKDTSTPKGIHYSWDLKWISSLTRVHPRGFVGEGFPGPAVTVHSVYSRSERTSSISQQNSTVPNQTTNHSPSLLHLPVTFLRRHLLSSKIYPTYILNGLTLYNSYFFSDKY